MRSSGRFRRAEFLFWLPVVSSILLLASLAGRAGADDAPAAAPDPVGSYQTTPTAASVPGYAKPDPEHATNKELATAVDAVAQSASRSYFSMNFVWVLFAGFLVMFMQAGFSLVETGLCRAKNAAHTMSMNFLVYAVGMTAFFICGFAFLYGGVNGTFIGGPTSMGGVPTLDSMFKVGQNGWGLFGTTGFMLTGKAYDAQVIVMFLFMMVFMDTTATIPTGALAERWNLKSFFIFSLFIGGIIYPIFGCWVWGGGWLAQLGKLAGIGHGLVDYAGSSVVHLQGGALALITCWLLGPRIGKYDANGKPKPILGHNIPMVILGTFILAFGWFGFNAGSSLAAADGRIGIVAVNTMLASASGALATCLYMWFVYGKPDPSMMCNGMLAGLVAITCPCAFVAPWAAFLIGAIAGVLVVWSVFFFEKRGLDDPVGAISVHGVNGAWGILALGLFADGTYGGGWNAVDGNVVGVFYNASLGAKQLAAQGIGVLVCITWNVVVGGVIFFLIGKMLGSNRVPAEVEIAGLDVPEMGVPGYPEYITPVAPETVPESIVAEAREQLRVPTLATAS
ncbi:ammonium transporter [soil metagenome]